MLFGFTAGMHCLWCLPQFGSFKGAEGCCELPNWPIDAHSNKGLQVIAMQMRKDGDIITCHACMCVCVFVPFMGKIKKCF